MNKILISLSLILAASGGAFAQSSASDVYQVLAFDGSVAVPPAVPTNDLITYKRVDKEGSPLFQAPKGGIDYTATGSVGLMSEDQIIYDRAGNDGSPRFK